MSHRGKGKALIHFVVTAGRPDRVAAAEVSLREALDTTRVCDGARVSHRGENGAWAMAGVSATDPLGADRIGVDHDSLVVVNGSALSSGGPQASLAHRSLRAFRAGGPAALADSLHGCFNVVAVDPDQGLLAFGDFSGLFPLYWRNDGDLLVVSNRSTTVREVFGAKGWSLRPMAWLLGHNNLFGPDVPAEGISSLPPGRQLRAPWATGSASIERGPTWVWPGSADVAQPGNLAPERWDEVTEHMVEGFRDLGQVQQPLRLQLTGGKDTRVVLALALAALGADGVETYTRDSLNRPELASASHVAEVAGVRHEIEGAAERDSHGPSTPAQVPFDAETHWARVRQHAYRYESIVCPWDGAAQPLVGTTVSVGGFGGELYRRSHSKRFRTADGGSLEQMADLFVDFHQPHDPMGVLTEEQGRFQERWLREWVAEAATETRLDLLPERFYVENRLGHWNGPLGQNTPTRIVINPLLSNLATSVNLTLSAEERSAERFHYEVIRRTAPGLLDLPFYRDAWSPRLDPRYVVPPAPRPRELPGAGTARLVGQVLRRRVPRLADRSRRANLPRKQADAPPRTWQWIFLEQERDRIADLLGEADRHSSMGDVCDLGKLRTVVRKGSWQTWIATESGRIPGLVTGKQVMSAVIIAVALLGREERFLDEP